jgi:hypothetical protein
MPKKRTQALFHKYINAEIYLILAMLKSKKHASIHHQKLKASETADKDNGLFVFKCELL